MRMIDRQKEREKERHIETREMRKIGRKREMERHIETREMRKIDSLKEREGETQRDQRNEKDRQKGREGETYSEQILPDWSVHMMGRVGQDKDATGQEQCHHGRQFQTGLQR